MYKVNWRGDKCKNFYNTRHKILGFCDHITAGTRQSVFYWFTSPNNTAGSSHYVVARDGSIDQYVQLNKSAWTQGIGADAHGRVTAPIVRDRPGVNPNYYMVGIEYEGYVEGHQENGETIVTNFGIDGSLTEEQFYAGCWLKKHLQDEIEKKYGHRIPLVRYNIEQHRRIDPKRKPNCPGDNFPVERQLTELAIADKMTLEAYEERLDYLLNPSAGVVRAYAVADRISSLWNRHNDPKYGAECKRKLLKFGVVEGKEGMEAIKIRVCDDLAKKLGKLKEAARKLNLYADFAEENNLM